MPAHCFLAAFTEYCHHRERVERLGSLPHTKEPRPCQLAVAKVSCSLGRCSLQQ